MKRPPHSACLLPLLLSAATLSAATLLAQTTPEVKPTKAPDPVKGMHDTSPLTVAEQARLQAARPLHASGPVAERLARDAAGAMPPSRLLFDEAGDGHVWALATSYKASFGPEGLTYVPFFGADAPANYPIRFVLRSVRVGGRELSLRRDAATAREGTRVTLDRGGVREVYDLTPTSVEQTFVVEADWQGDVDVELEVESSLPELGGDGVRFGNALGHVEYGAACLVDGPRKTEIECALSGRSIHLHVDAAQRPSAGAVVIDPLIRTNSSAWAVAHPATNPDIAYDASTDRYLVVQEILFSSTDSDVVCELFDGNGLPVANSQHVIDSTPLSNQAPRVANLATYDRFLIVTQQFDPQAPAGQQRKVLGRTVSAQAPFPVGFVYQVSDPLYPGDAFAADVGGDPKETGPSKWAVVYTRAVSGNDWDIMVRQVSELGSGVADTVLVENSANTIFTNPQISLSNADGIAAAPRWLVVYSFRYSATDWDVYGASLDQNFSIRQPNRGIDTSTSNDLYPYVSSPCTDWTNGNPVFMVSYERQSPPAMMGVVVDWQLTPIVPQTDLTARFGFGSFWCRTESDGCRFVVTHGRGAANDQAIEVATLAVVDGGAGAHFALQEASQPLARTTPPFTAYRAATPMLASKRAGGGPLADYGVAFIDLEAVPQALTVATYEGRTPGPGASVRSTGCGGLGLALTGRPYLGETMRFALSNHGNDLYGSMLGFPGPTLPLCSAGCGFGLAPDGPVVNFSNRDLLTLTIPCTVHVIGARMAAQGYAFGSGSCLSLFRFSDTIDFTIR